MAGQKSFRRISKNKTYILAQLPTQPFDFLLPLHLVDSKNNPKSKNNKLTKDKKIAIGAAALVLVVIIVLLVTIGGSTGKKTAAGSHHSTTTVPIPTVSKHLCPLTDEPAPGGIVPARPALGVKIGNEPPPGDARPQSGLNEADIVYDTPAEGFIMRYIAVYQCNNASEIGPTRSIRWVDQRIMRQFVHPILVSAGGIIPNLTTAENSKWLSYANLLTTAQNAGVRISSRVPPDNLYTSTSALYGLFPKQTTPPKPVFQYTNSLPSSAQPAADIGINFSYGTDVIWKWNPQLGQYIHTYSGQTDIDALTGKPVSATNIVIQIVTYKFGPYAESPGSTGDVESKTIGSGQGWIVRNGKEIPVTWHRPQLLDGTTFTDKQGQEVGLAPGRTWVELVPNTTATVKGDITFTR